VNLRPCALALLAALTPAAPAAAACDKLNQKVAAVMNKTVAVYDPTGQYQQDIDSKLLLGATVTDCRSAPTLVLVRLTAAAAPASGPHEAWVDLLDVKLSGDTVRTERKCAPTSVARPADQLTTATSGIGACRDQ